MRRFLYNISDHQFMRWITLILWCCLIFFLSAQSVLPGAPSGLPDFIFKKSAHMTVYAFLYLFAVRAFSTTNTRQFKQAALFSIVFAISDEFHQSFVPGRTPNIMDIGFDSVGMLAMWVVIKKRSWR